MIAGRRAYFITLCAYQSQELLSHISSGRLNHLNNSPGAHLLQPSYHARILQTEAASAGFYSSSGWERDYPKIQILTIEELLDGAEVKMPPTRMTFKQAQKVRERGPEQG